MLDCTITVPGGGSGQGCLKHPKTGKVSELIRDLEAYYKAIYRHCLECRICDPNEVLKRFLENRDKPTPNRRTTGTTTALLVNMAAKYVRNVPGTDVKWLREYLLRCDSLGIAIKHREALTQKELIELVMKDGSREWMALADELPEDDFLSKSMKYLEYRRSPDWDGWLTSEISSFERRKGGRKPERTWAFKATALLIESGGVAPSSVEELKKMMPVVECMAT